MSPVWAAVCMAAAVERLPWEPWSRGMCVLSVFPALKSSIALTFSFEVAKQSLAVIGSDPLFW